jgi:hypothetical protein
MAAVLMSRCGPSVYPPLPLQTGLLKSRDAVHKRQCQTSQPLHECAARLLMLVSRPAHSCRGRRPPSALLIDTATMKAEFLAHHSAGRIRPRSHYSMGWLPALAQLASRAPQLVNALTQPPGLRDVLTTMGGIDRRRRIPLFAG